MTDTVLALVGLYAGITLFLLGLLWAKLDKERTMRAHFQEAYLTLKGVTDRFGIVSDMTEAVLAATAAKATQNAKGGDS